MKRSLSLFVLLFVVVQSSVWTAAAADNALYEDAIHTARREIWKTMSSREGIISDDCVYG